LRVLTERVEEAGSQGGAGLGRSDEEGREPEGVGRSTCALIVIEDSGIGIPDDVYEHIFEPFFTTKEKGSGLGLSSVQRVVENHGGVLEVSSEANRGTRFRIFLPLFEGADV
jgi:signal transduction histidine kinase